MPQLDESESSVREIAKVIRDLSRQTTVGWVSWKLVAKQLSGTAEYADMLMAIASLERWRPIFAMNGSVVKLTLQGLEFAATITAQPLNEIQRIGKAVTYYAGRLHDIWLEVRGISRVAAVGSRVVQAVEVDHDDEPVASETPVQFCPAGTRTGGKIVGQEADGSVLYVAFDAEIFPGEPSW